MWKEYIKPAIPSDWEAIRADESSESGLITKKYIEAIYDADVFIADLTFNNPNVFYELGIRQVLSKKGIVLIQQNGNQRPFDVQTQKVIDYNLFMGTTTRKFIEILKQTLVTAGTDTKGSPVHDFLPNLSIYNSSDGESPRQKIKNLSKKIVDLSVDATLVSGSAEQFERQRSLRSELTDLLSKIVRAQVKNIQPKSCKPHT